MVGKFAVALLIAASPGLAQEAVTAEPAEGVTATEAPAAPVAYKTKKVCRSIEVVGSSIPRTTCTTRKIPIKPKVEEASPGAQTAPQPEGQL